MARLISSEHGVRCIGPLRRVYDVCHKKAFNSQLVQYSSTVCSLVRILVPTLIHSQDGHIVQQFVTPQALTVLVSV